MSRPPVETSAERFRTINGGRIDRTRRLSFTFDGKPLTGHPGDTLASALLASGVHLVGRSFKYHRPRGILSAGSEEPNALVTVRRGWRRATPNLRATEVELYDGLVAESQNRWPSLAFDLASVNDRLAPLLSAGFYYKTFMGPRWGRLGANGAWTRLYEPLIRRMAGLGRAPLDSDPDRYATRYDHCDALIVGAGPAGLMAALAAAEAGLSVIVADEQAEPGGSLLAETTSAVHGRPAWTWLADTVAQLARMPRVRLLPRTTAFGCYPDHLIGLAERLGDHLAEVPKGLPRERLWQVRAREVVLATGAIERPLVFPGNDRPGIMLAGAVETYLERFGVMAGTRAVVVTACDSAYPIAANLAEHGIEVARIVELRQAAGEAARATAEAARLAIVAGAEVVGTRGRHRVRAAEIAAPGDRRERIDCDLVAMAGGFTPTLHLFSQLRGQLAWDEAAGTLLPAAAVPHVHVAGAAAGRSGLTDVLESGARAGEAAARSLASGGASQSAATPTRLSPRSATSAPSPARRRPAPPAGRAFVDFQNDVTASDLALATREGFQAIEHVKRYTTTGMATDQGKTSNVNALGLVGGLLGRGIDAVGHTTFRPPYTPVTFGTLAGEARGQLLDPIRVTGIDPSSRARGAVFEDVGQWQRARYFPRPGEDMHAAVARECRTVRGTVGVLDASTLGKIEVVGPGAAEFLDRLYVTALASLPVGRCRYAVMLSEAGFVMDDGIVARLADDRFHITTTTGGAARVLAHMEDYRQTEFTDLVCWLTSTTEQWGVIAVQGPKARDVLEPLIEGVNIAAGALPHMGVAEGRILGVPMRLFRVSFTGELGYEVNVASGYARDIWDELLARSEALGGCPYGTEAMHVLRAEKGFIIVGQESDGTVTPGDLGLPVGKAKADFVGKRSLARPDMVVSDRPQLVGLEVAEGGGVLEEGAQVTQHATPRPGTPALGHVTSAYWSEALRQPIALALVKGGRARIGETLHVPMPDGARVVRVVSPVFYDPLGDRIDG
ncbi:MAG: sarcosine oxidase subunit alpha family protein [Hyphomicrobiaceae bacterium]|nr:sarcosine oxidase subunit alpha family protein [Hyphomicrobiaceae bacterium]